MVTVAVQPLACRPGEVPVPAVWFAKLIDSFAYKATRKAECNDKVKKTNKCKYIKLFKDFCFYQNKIKTYLEC